MKCAVELGRWTLIIVNLSISLKIRVNRLIMKQYGKNIISVLVCGFCTLIQFLGEFKQL